MRSRPPLESLALILDRMANEEVIRCLELLPSLKELSIRFAEDIADALIFPGLDDAHTRRKLCPNLELIEINSIDGSEVETISRKVLDIMASRTFKGVPMTRVVFPTFQ